MGEYKQINTSHDPETVEMIMALKKDLGYGNRETSAFFRWLVHQEWRRRHGYDLPEKHITTNTVTEKK